MHRLHISQTPMMQPLLKLQQPFLLTCQQAVCTRRLTRLLQPLQMGRVPLDSLTWQALQQSMACSHHSRLQFLRQ
jgi:hypothetical protein